MEGIKTLATFSTPTVLSVVAVTKGYLILVFIRSVVSQGSTCVLILVSRVSCFLDMGYENSSVCVIELLLL